MISYPRRDINALQEGKMKAKKVAKKRAKYFLNVLIFG
jgi:hypothetical protein